MPLLRESHWASPPCSPFHPKASNICVYYKHLLTKTEGVGIENKLPPVTYLKAIDVWIFMCTSFVFAALLEFSVANYVWRMEGKGRGGEKQYFRQQASVLLLFDHISKPKNNNKHVLLTLFISLSLAAARWPGYCWITNQKKIPQKLNQWWQHKHLCQKSSASLKQQKRLTSEAAFSFRSSFSFFPSSTGFTTVAGFDSSQ